MSAEEQDTQLNRFPGHEFANARESLHLSEAQVSTELHLPIKVIKAIESGNPQSFQNPVFIRGYIRTYAKRLGLDPNHYANLYANLPGIDLRPSTIKSTTSVKERDPSRSPLMKLFSWLFVLVIIAVIIWWSREQSGRSPVVLSSSTSSVIDSMDREQPEDVFDPTVFNLSATSASEGVSVAAFSDGQLDPEQTSLDVLTNEDVLEEIVEVETLEARDQEPMTDKSLYMRFSGDCWVQIRDANDVLLYSGVAQGGSELQLDGDLPLSLVIGRRDAVAELRFNGEVVDMASFTTGNVARFSLPLGQ